MPERVTIAKIASYYQQAFAVYEAGPYQPTLQHADSL